MLRRLLRDGKVVDDDWHYESEARSDDGVIIAFEHWRSQRERWSAFRGRLGIVVLPADDIVSLAPDLARFALIAAQFPGPSDGRGYTQGRLLRERWAFAGELRASGYVRHDQVFFLARCGFNSFEMPDNELAHAAGAFATFSAEYQPSNDAGLPVKLRHR